MSLKTKQINVRYRLRYDTLANWTSVNPVLRAGEMSIVAVPSNSSTTVDQITKPAILFKVGDGTTAWVNLPWASGYAADVYEWAKAATKPSYNWGEIGDKPQTFAPSAHDHERIKSGNAIISFSADKKAPTFTADGSTILKILTEADKTTLTSLINAAQADATKALGRTGNDVNYIDVDENAGVIYFHKGTSKGEEIQTVLTTASAYTKTEIDNTMAQYSKTGEDSSYIAANAMGQPNGVATLDSNGKIPTSQIPGSVDEIQEYGSADQFPNPGEEGKMYVAKDTNLTYRWSGTQYVEISPSLALGETADTAYAGDKGAATTTKVNTHVGNSDIHVTAANKTNWNDANSKKHTHNNKAILDATTASYTTADKTKLGKTITTDNIADSDTGITDAMIGASTDVPSANATARTAKDHRERIVALEDLDEIELLGGGAQLTGSDSFIS